MSMLKIREPKNLTVSNEVIIRTTAFLSPFQNAIIACSRAAP